MAGIARQNQMMPSMIGGVADHVHVLATIPATIPISKAVQLIKGASSHWFKSTFSNTVSFAWQDGYGAFSVSEAQTGMVREYIRTQEEHHRTRTFAEEYRALLEQHGVQFDERYWLG
jgi:hypothetical protein